MTANVLRDAQVLPTLHAILEGGLPCYLDQARQVLTELLGARGRRRQRVDAAARAAVDLHTWRASPRWATPRPPSSPPGSSNWPLTLTALVDIDGT